MKRVYALETEREKKFVRARACARERENRKRQPPNDSNPLGLLLLTKRHDLTKRHHGMLWIWLIYFGIFFPLSCTFILFENCHSRQCIGWMWMSFLFLEVIILFPHANES